VIFANGAETPAGATCGYAKLTSDICLLTTGL